jgi:protein SCO1
MNRRGFPDLELVTHEGRRVRFYEDLVRDRIVMMNFFYVNCDGICPRSTGNLKQVQRLLDDRVGRDVHMYSFTLKPAEDTPAVLKQYAEGMELGRGWQLLTGRPAHIETLRRHLGFADRDPKVDEDVSNHIGLVVVGNDRIDRWAACPAISNPAEIVKLVRAMEPFK